MVTVAMSVFGYVKDKFSSFKFLTPEEKRRTLAYKEAKTKLSFNKVKEEKFSFAFASLKIKGISFPHSCP